MITHRLKLWTTGVALLVGLSLYAQKSVYIPSNFRNAWEDDYCNKNGQNGTINSIDDMKDDSERWSKNRSYQTDNIVCFWEAGFGTDPEKMINPNNTSQTFNLKTFLAACEEIFDHHVNTLHATWDDGTYLTKYKFMFMLNYTTSWMAYGGGYDYVIGAMWLDPAALGVNSTAEYPYFTLAHELFHSMSYQCYSDRPSEEYRAFQDTKNGAFWERSANHGALQMYPNVNEDFARYMYATHSHFLNTRKHYTTSFFLENLTQTEGVLALGELWKRNLKDEHPMQTACRYFFDNNQAKLNAFVAESAMKMVTFNFNEGTNGRYYKSVVDGLSYPTDGTGIVQFFDIIQKKHRTILYAVNAEKNHYAIRDCQAPQDYGFNAIQIFPTNLNADGSATFKMHFRGHNENDSKDANKKSGWAYGFVAKRTDGTVRMGNVYDNADQTISFTKEATDSEVWLVVAGAPTEHNSAHNYSWEAGLPKYYRYPYEVCFENAVPMGYNDDYEGAKSNGAPHSNGGGWVASTATVASTAYVGPNAKVLGSATVSDNARIEDYAIVKGAAKVYGNAVVKENAMVFTNAEVYGDAVISGSARVFNGSKVYGNAFVTDNAFLISTEVKDNAICCGNLWQREYGFYYNTSGFKIEGTCVAGGDCEDAGNLNDSGSSESSGTFLQWPESGNNSRSRHDGLGNLSVDQITTLRNNWNDLNQRFSILNASHTSNYDINYPYSYFTDDEMTVGESVDEGEFTVTNKGSYVAVTGKVPDGTTYSVMNAAGVAVSEGNIYSATSVVIPSSCQSGKYTVKIQNSDNSYCEIISK